MCAPTGTMTRAKEIARATSRPISAIRQSILGVYRARSRNGVHISDHRLTALIHMHMLDADSLRIAVPQTP